MANPPSSAAVSASARKYLIKYTGYGKNNAEDDDDARCEAHGIDQQKNAHKPSNMQDTTFTYALISLKNDVCLQNKCIGSRIVERIPHKLLQHKGCRTFFEISVKQVFIKCFQTSDISYFRRTHLEMNISDINYTA